MLTSRFVAPLFVSVVVLTACAEDLTEQKTQWDAMQKDWAAKVEKVKKSHEELLAKTKGFALPAGDEALAGEKAALDKAIEGTAAGMEAADKAIGAAKASIDGLIAKGKRVPVEVALGTTKSTVDGSLARAASLVSAAGENFEQLEKKMAVLKAEGDATKSRSEAWAGEAKKKGGMLSIDDVAFTADQVNVDKSRVALNSLVATLKACGELRVELAVTANSEAADLGGKRAEALKAYLTGKGVDAAVLAKVSGKAEKDAEEKVSVSVTTPCK